MLNLQRSQETMGIATPSYASRWYITLYSAGVVPYRTLLRIWDIFLLEGFEWLYFMALALLKYHEGMSKISNIFWTPASTCTVANQQSNACFCCHLATLT